MNKWLIGKDENRMRRSYLWNTLSGFFNALQSTIILFALARIDGNELSGGVFSVVFATANLMLSLGKYGVRYYQVSDVENRHSYGEYFTHRIFTSFGMVIATVAFCAVSFLYGGYSADKALFCLFLCLQKIVDSIEDVIHGEYQRHGYLDVASKSMFIRLLITVGSFLVAYAVSRSLVTAAVVSLLASVIALSVLALLVRGCFDKPQVRSLQGVKTIFIRCFPLFATAFLSLFIVNAPKYAIDFICDDGSVQGIYGYVSLPVLVVSLLAECLFRPMITSFSLMWNARDIKSFLKKMSKVVLGIGILTVICTVGGVLLGVPVLSFIFNIDLREYWLSVGILLIGGGFLSLTSFLNVIMTVIGKNNSIALSHTVASVAAMPIALFFVRNYELLGAAIAYLVIIVLLTLSVVALLFRYVIKEIRK